MPTALRNIHNALVPGGWLVMCILGAPPDPLSQALAVLKLARIGTYSWTASEVKERLRHVSFEQVETFSHAPTTVGIVERKAIA